MGMDNELHTRLTAQDSTLSSIKTDVGLLRKELIGNGQPGRLPKLEDKVEDLVAHKNRALGWLSAFALLLTIGLTIFEYLHHLPPAIKP